VDQPLPAAHDLDLDPLPYQLALKDRALGSSSEGITISDLRLPDNPLVYVNRGFMENTGYSREDSIGRNCRYLQGPDTDPDAVAKIRRTIAERRSCVVELLNYRQDGSSFWNRLSLTPLRNSSNEVTHYIGVQSDVTRRRLAEESLLESNARLENANKKMRRNLMAAARIQRALLPEHFFNQRGVSVAWLLEACDELAGDTLNVIRLDEDHLGLYVLDVSGHGVQASLLSVTLHHWLSADPERETLRSTRPDSRAEAGIVHPHVVAQELNQHFPMDPDTNQYFTILYGILTLSSGEFRYVTAGHPPLVHMPSNKAAYQVTGLSSPIGFFPQTRYETKTLSLEPGDRLFLFSDGLSETWNESEVLFGSDRLLAAIEATRTEAMEPSIKAIARTSRRWHHSPTLHDDLTLVGLEWNA
jgi:PAS domain S-box-containing protein